MTQRWTRRRFLFAAGGGALFAARSVCADVASATPKNYRLAVPLQGMTAEFMQLWVRGARAHPAVKSGLVNLTIFDGRLDALTQANQFDTIITQRFDAIIFIPVDITAGNEPARRARLAGIPLIGSNTLVSDASTYTRYIGSDDVEGGRLLATTVVRALGGTGNIVILEGPIGHSAQIQRREGIQAVLSQTPNVKVLRMKSANWSRAEAMSLMENWLTALGADIKGVIAQNDEMAIGALEAIKARGIRPAKLSVAGIDGLSDALAAVKRGEMSTLLQDATAQAQGSIDLALRVLVGAAYQPLSAIWSQYKGILDWHDGTLPRYTVPWVPVTRENVDQLLALRKST